MVSMGELEHLQAGDKWSLGAVLYTLLFNSRAFEGENDEQM